MSWRKTLGVSPSTEQHYAHNSQNTQKPDVLGNCAEIANCAYNNPARTIPGEIEGVAIVNTSKKEAELLSRLNAMRNQMDKGIRPKEYDKPAFCHGCGPVWLWFSGDVLGCPWCWNRASGNPIPRPYTTQCGNCFHFKRIDHPHLGHCSQGQPENIAGLWDDDNRLCDKFLPLVNNCGENDEQE